METSPLKQALKVTLVTIALVFVGDRALSFLCATLMSHCQDRYVDLYEGRAHVDVVALGNSRADHHFPAARMTRRLGHPVQNYGIGGISTVLVEALLRDHVERNGKPKVVIVETHSMTIAPNQPGDLRLFATYSDRLAAIVKRATPSLYYSGKVLNLVEYNSEMFTRVLMSLAGPRGDRVFNRSVPPELLESLSHEQPFRLNSMRQNEAALVRIVDFCEQERIPLYVVVTPFLPEQAALITNLDEWTASIGALVGTRAHFLNYARAIPEHTRFQDGTHLNGEGVARLFELMSADGVYAHLGAPAAAAGSEN